MSTATLEQASRSFHTSHPRTQVPVAHRYEGQPLHATPWDPPSERSQVQLTRRGRLVLFIVLVAVALAVFVLVGGPADSTGTTHHPAAVTVVVAPGQTLWDIAGEVAPNEDPRTVIAEILDLNALTDPGLIRVGQPLYVPGS